MRFPAVLTLIALAAAVVPGGPANARSLVVAELFTSQGCSSCIDSARVMADLAQNPRVLGLTFGVDYWDYLGWRDTFAQPAFADRQRAYETRFQLKAVYTPQLVVDGRAQAAATPADKAEALVRSALRASRPAPDIATVGAAGDRVAVGSARMREAADVWLVRYEPKVQQVAVGAGENKGRKVEERNVVRELVRLGAWRGRPRVFRLPPPSAPGLSSAIIVQGTSGGRIYAASGL